jgi:hypothetical protein
MSKQLLKDSLGWGFVLWLIGYLLGIVLFFVLPPSLIGWAIMPVGMGITLWILLRRVKRQALQYYVILALAWVAIALVCDYIFIVKAISPPDGYYKTDVFVYYTLTVVTPLAVGWWKASRFDVMQPA